MSNLIHKSAAEVTPEEWAFISPGYLEAVEDVSRQLSQQYGDTDIITHMEALIHDETSDIVVCPEKLFPHHDIIISYEGKDILGFAISHTENYSNPAYPEIEITLPCRVIDLMYVSKDHRRKKHGAELITSLCDIRDTPIICFSCNTFNRGILACAKSVREWHVGTEYRCYTGWLDNFRNTFYTDLGINVTNNRQLTEQLEKYLTREYENLFDNYPDVDYARPTLEEYMTKYLNNLRVSCKSIYIHKKPEYGCVMAEGIKDTRYTRLYPLLDDAWLGRAVCGGYLKGIMRSIDGKTLPDGTSRFFIVSGKSALAKSYDKHSFKCYSQVLWSKL